MTHHLNEWEISAAAADLDLEEDRRKHLRHCLACRRSVASFRETIGLRREDLGRPQPDWEGQKAAVLQRISEKEPRRRPIIPRRLRPLLAAAATIVLAVGAAVISSRTGPSPSPTPLPSVPIEDILSQTESLLADDGLVDLDIFDTITDDELNAVFPEHAS